MSLEQWLCYDVDVDVVDLRAQADASMPASSNNVNYTINYTILWDNTERKFQVLKDLKATWLNFTVSSISGGDIWAISVHDGLFVVFSS